MYKFYFWKLFFSRFITGDYIPGNGLTFASKDDNYKVVLEVIHSLYLSQEECTMTHQESLIKIPITDFELDEYV